MPCQGGPTEWETAASADDGTQWHYPDPEVGPDGFAPDPLRYSITDQIDMLLDGYHPADATYSVTFTAEIDADTGSSTMREEISLAELQAIRSILALRPR